jgi:DNA adenine methylase
VIAHPPLRYHGSKWRLAPWIIGHFPPHRMYVEPFSGGAAILLRKRPSQVEIYNDIDERVVNFFRMARSRTSELSTQLLLTPYARSEAITCRERSPDPLEDARRSCVLSWQLFGGGQGQWHTAFRIQRGSSPNNTTGIWQRLPLQLPDVAKRLRRVQIENLPALDCIARYDAPDTLFYLDPPYLQVTRSKWRKSAYRHEMADPDHIQLADLLHSIEGMALLSGYPSELYDGLYPDWQRIDTEARTDRGKTVVESLWISPAAQAQQGQQSLFVD